MTDTKDLIREIQEHTAAHGGENTATHLLVQAVMALQRQADELAAIGAGGVEPLRKINQPEPTVPDQTQDWAGMDGATAYLLIQRHADNWADAAKMMGEWLDANQRQSFDAADMAAAAAQGFRDGVASLAANAGGPVVDRATVIEWLDANDIEVTDRQLGGLFHFSAPPTASAQGFRDGVATHPSPPEGMAGWKWVPIEPTDAMWNAMMDWGTTKSEWLAILDAAPGPADGESNG